MRTPATTVLSAAAAIAIVASPRSACALFDAGAQAGFVARSASAPGLGFGLHGDVDLLPLVKVGPYLLHYELSASHGEVFAVDAPDLAANAKFNAIGLRARLRLPLTARLRSHLLFGLGHTFAQYAAPLHRSGRFWECPIGLGISYEVADNLELSLDGAYRPGFAFSGGAFEVEQRPASGWSLLLGATVSF